MNKSKLEIDISGSNNENDGEDLMKIRLKSQSTVQINFSQFLFLSKYVSEKCAEIMQSIEKEIAELENKFEIKEEIIKEFIKIVKEEKASIPIEHYKDIYTLSKHFCIPKLSAVQLENNILKFSLVSELSGQEIVWVSGTRDHCLVVSRDGRVFGRGSNSDGQLGLGQQTSEVSSFTEISSLKGHTIRAAYAGCFHSFFETVEGKILACGYNYYSELLLSSDSRKKEYSPIETTITESATFCIAGCFLSTVFIGGDPPPNTPNRLIKKFE